MISRWCTFFLIAILMLAAALRFYQALAAPTEYIEQHEFIPAAESISWSHLPIREYQHPSFPAYVIRLSKCLFGPISFGHQMLPYRGLSVLFGVGTVYLMYLIGARWWGPPAGLVAAGLLAVSNYHVAVTGLAIDLGIDLFFVALAMWSFSRFLGQAERRRAARWLLLTGLITGVAFLCKEIAVLLPPIYFLACCLVPSLRCWLRRWELYAAAGLFLLVILPDLLLGGSAGAVRPEYTTAVNHLSKITGLGFSDQPLLFYFGDLFVYFQIPHLNVFTEMPFQWVPLSLILWAGVLFAAVLRRKDALTVFLLAMFALIFVFFSVIRTTSIEVNGVMTDPVNWYWVDRTILPATLLAGLMIQRVVARLLRRMGFSAEGG